ncbi:MAG: lysostaphin resistance A-like protein, partial [Gemmatimonadota bacterium]
MTTDLQVLLPSSIARGFALLLLAGLPVLAAATGIRESQVEEITASRPAVYVSAALSMAALGGITLAVAAWQRIPAAALGWSVSGTGVALLWAAGATAAGLFAVWLITGTGRRLGLRESGLALALMPRSAADRRGFVLLAIVAAVGEEYIYRGYTLHVLAEWWGDPWLAAAATAVSFGFAHGYQRVVGVVRATALGG